MEGRKKIWIKNILTLIISLWIALTVNFLIPRLMPGNPISTLIASYRGALSPEAIYAIEKAFGLTGGNIFESYFIYLSEIFRGNLGISIRFFPTPILTIIAYALPWTIFLVGVGLIISFSLGVLLGMVLAWKRGSITDSVVTTFLIFLRSFPYFCIAIIILYYAGYKLRIVPLSHAYNLYLTPSFSGEFLLSVLYHAVAPLSVIIASTLGEWMLVMRNNMIVTLQEDFVELAKAKGLHERRIITSYAGRNAILPSMTSLAMYFGIVMGGSLLVEMVFSYPGIGMMLYQAVIFLDYPLMQAIFLIIAFTVMIANFIVEIIYAKLDPRIGARQ